MGSHLSKQRDDHHSHSHRMGTGTEELSRQRRRQQQQQEQQEVTTIIGPPQPNATARSPLFQTLPAEVRRHILVAAFGERTIHVQTQTQQRYHPAIVCFGRHDGASPVDDDCERSYHHHRGSTNYQGANAGWRVGAAGWLLVCRQAYAEGTEVLYGTNTFSMRSRVNTTLVILDHRIGSDSSSPPLVDAGIPPRFVDCVTSLEWIIEPSPPPGFSSGGEDKDNNYNNNNNAKDDHSLSSLFSVLSRLPVTMPGLRTLYLGFRRGTAGVPVPYPLTQQDDGQGASARFRAYTERVLAPLDAVVAADPGYYFAGRQLGGGRFEVGLPTSAFHAHLNQGLGGDRGARFELPGWPRNDAVSYKRLKMDRPGGGWGPRERIWHAVTPPPVGADDGLDYGGWCGYWLGETESDMVDGWMVSMPFYWRDD